MATVITRNSYSISKIKTLIDLNHNMINFKVKFNIESKGNTFSTLIIDQNTLDNVETDNLEYKTVDGELSGEIISDKNTYQNYYIILKSDVPVAVEVMLETEHLPDFIGNENENNSSEEGGKIFVDVKYIFLLIVLAVGVYLVYNIATESSSSASKKGGIGESLLAKLKKLPLE